MTGSALLLVLGSLRLYCHYYNLGGEATFHVGSISGSLAHSRAPDLFRDAATLTLVTGGFA